VRIVIVICVISILSVCGIFLFVYRGTPENVVPQIASAKQKTPTPQPKKQADPQPRDIDEFYQIIIDNNIFRPLNWQPQQQRPDYQLLGTIINTDNTHKTAYIIDTKSNQFHNVTTGDTIGEATIQNITAKKITLNTKKGELILTLNGNTFLNAKRNTQHRRSVPNLSHSINPQPKTSHRKIIGSLKTFAKTHSINGVNITQKNLNL